MATARTLPTPASAEAPHAGAWLTPLRAVLLMVALYLGAVVVYAILGHGLGVPLLHPDEFRYEHFARSVANGDGFTWWGQPQSFGAKPFIYLLTPAWVVAGGTTAYHLAQAEGAVFLCLTAVPVWLIVRSRTTEWWGLAAAALTLAGTWMLTSAGILTENLALPASAGVLAGTVAYLESGARRQGIGVLALALIAIGLRVQMVVLVPTLLLIVIVDVLRVGRSGWREQLALRRTPLIVLGAAVGLGLIAVLATDGRVLGDYRALQHPRLAGVIAGETLKHLVAIAVTTGLLPFMLVLAASLRPSNWRSRELGPVLAVTWSSALIFCVVAATAVHWYDVPWTIPRYAEYSVPMFIAAAVLVAAHKAAGARELIAVTVVAAPLLLLTPGVENYAEEHALHATYHITHFFIGGTEAQGLAVMTGLVGGAAAALVSGRVDLRALTAGTALVAMAGAILVTQSAIEWHWTGITADATRKNLPPDLKWVDHAAGGPVGRMVVNNWNSRGDYTDFFNERIDAAYVRPGAFAGTPSLAQPCTWSTTTNGTLQVSRGCAVPRRVLVDDTRSRLVFHGQRLLHADKRTGWTLAALPPKPRVLAVVQLPCTQPRTLVLQNGLGKPTGLRRRCREQFAITLFTDEPNELDLAFRGGDADTTVVLGRRQVALKARQAKTVTFKIPAGQSVLDGQLTFAWSNIRTAPDFVEASLKSRDGHVTQLYHR